MTITLILGIIFAVSAYLIIGAVIGCAVDGCDDDVMWAFVVFWVVLLPVYATVKLIKAIIKLFKGEL